MWSSDDEAPVLTKAQKKEHTKLIAKVTEALFVAQELELQSEEQFDETWEALQTPWQACENLVPGSAEDIVSKSDLKKLRKQHRQQLAKAAQPAPVKKAAAKRK